MKEVPKPRSENVPGVRQFLEHGQGVERSIRLGRRKKIKKDQKKRLKYRMVIITIPTTPLLSFVLPRGV